MQHYECINGFPTISDIAFMKKYTSTKNGTCNKKKLCS